MADILHSTDLTEIISQHHRQDALLEVLHDLQQQYGSLSDKLLSQVAEQMALPPSLVLGVASFYHHFHRTPPGTHRCVICTGTSCHLKGGSRLLEELEQRFELPCGSTSEDGSLSLETVRCIGACGLAPLAIVDDRIIGEDEDLQQMADTISQAIGERLAGDRLP